MIEISRRQSVAIGVVGLALLVSASLVAGQFQSEPPFSTPDHPAHPMHDLKDATAALPIATVLGTVLALRPRRRDARPRLPEVVQTQIILAIVGAVIMLIVGASVARAFAIVGAASLIRYRSKIDDPKDAGVMLSALAVGLACGVGIYALAAFSTGFIVLVLWIIEALEPQGLKTFELKIKAKDTAPLRNAVESLLRRQHIKYELRTSATEELTYEVKVPYGRRTDRMSNAILLVDPNADISVEWDEKGKKSK
ncbi:MAG: DUF4956 domain-containing protein [Vicinamibacterales bacterium]